MSTALLRPATKGCVPRERRHESMRGILAGLDRCDALLSRHLTAAIAHFGSPALGVIDLPTLPTSAGLSADQIRAAASLYWASEIEEAGLPGFVEALAEGVVDGRLSLALTTGAA